MIPAPPTNSVTGSLVKLGRRSFLVGLAATAATACAGGSRPELADEPGSTSDAGSTVGPAAPEGDPTGEGAAEPTPTSEPLPRYIDSGPIGAGVALTFHVDGDPVIAAGLLDALRDRATPITAFLIGRWIDDHPDLARRFVDEGHEVANHTYNHQDMTSFVLTQVVDEYLRCAEAMESVVGVRGRWARPSAIDVPTELMIEAARVAGYESSVGFNVDPFDYVDPGVEAIRSGSVDGLQGGEIVSLHFGHQQTLDALPSIIDGIESRGLQPVTISDLLSV